ncbi:uncharacterized protein LOC135467238 [Liolophura sinensis]|uniref:uncharacterized protein LOC135467238 n=1 Tax=Liolophura sinensis TaxID=3198878 RepID=UPI003158DC28
MPEERQTTGYLSGQGTDPPKPKLASGKYYDIAATLFSTGRSGELVDLFIAAARDGDYSRIESLVQRRGDAVVSVDVKDKRTGNTALIWAAKRGHNKIVQLLLKHGADVTLKNYDGKTAVEVASPGIKTLLLDAVAQTSLSVHQRLLQAAWQGNAVMVKQLLSENKVLDIDCQNSDGLTPLMLLCRDLRLFERLSVQLHRDYNPAHVLAILLDHRANVHAVDADGKSGLHYVSLSSASCAKQLAEDLLHHGSQTDQRDRQCFTPIHFASQTGNVGVITTLIDGGSEVNIRGFAGATPLHYTAYNDHDRAAATLLEHGADISLTDDQGMTALDVARSKRMKSCLREAWAEMVQSRQEVSLAPVRQPTRDGSRLSMRGDTPDLRAETPQTRRHQGEVLFDGLPLNPFGSPIIHSSRKSKPAKPMTPGEKAAFAEEQMLIERGKSSSSLLTTKSNMNVCPFYIIREGVRRLGVCRQGSSRKPNPLPQWSRSVDKLPPVHGDGIESASSKQKPKPGAVRYQRSLTEISKATQNNKLSKLYTYPRAQSRRMGVHLSRDSPIAVTRLTPDVDEENRLKRLTQTPSRPTPTRLTPNTQTPGRQTPSNRRSHTMSSPCLADLAFTCNDYLFTSKRRSMSTPSCGMSDDYDTEEEEELLFSPKGSPHQTGSPPGTDRARVKIPSTIEEIRCMSVQGCPLPTLEQMRLTKSVTPVQGERVFPNSKRVLPPTPVQKSLSSIDQLLDVSNGCKDRSPNSSEEFDEGIHLTSGGEVIQLERRKPFLKTEFIIEESRPKDLILHSSGSDSCDSLESNPVKPVPGSSPVKSEQATVAKVMSSEEISTASRSSTKYAHGVSAPSQYPAKSTQGSRGVTSSSFQIHTGSIVDQPISQASHGVMVNTWNTPSESAEVRLHQNPVKGTSNTDKLRTVAKDNATLAEASRAANSVANVSLSFAGNDQLIVAGEQKHDAASDRDDAIRQEISKSYTPAPTPSQKSPVKVPVKSAAQKPNSASQKSMAVNPTRLISSMKKRAILRSKQTASSDTLTEIKENASSSRQSQVSGQNTVTSRTTRKSVSTLSGNSQSRPQDGTLSKSVPASVPSSISAPAKQSIVDNGSVKQAQVESGSSESDCQTLAGSPVKESTQIKPHHSADSSISHLTEHLGKTPLVKIFSTQSEPRFVSRPMEAPIIEQTPLIVNPFEDFFSNIAGANVSENADSNTNSPVKQQRVNSASSRKQMGKTKVMKVAQLKGKPAHGSVGHTSTKRVSSGRRRASRAEQKEEKRPGSNTRSKSRPKSGKRVRSGKNRGKKADKENLGREAAKPDVALISGIGWHIATSCEDKSDIQAVRLNLNSDSSDEEDILIPKLSPFRPFSSPSPRFVEVKTQPQQCDMNSILNHEELPPMNLDMSRNTIHGCPHGSQLEVNHAGVQLLLDDKEVSEQDMVDQTCRLAPALHGDLLKCALSPIPESPSLVSRTSSSLQQFSQTITDKQLSDLLGVCQANVPISHRSISGHQGLSGTTVGPQQAPRTTGGQEAAMCDDNDSDDTLVSHQSESGNEDGSSHSKAHNSKFVEVKQDNVEESVDEIVEEILSSTGPASLNSTLRSNWSASSRNNTLTEADSKILKSLHNTESPFHAKVKNTENDALRESTDQESYLGANPDLLKVFHDDDFKLGQRMKAMIDAGADHNRVKAMIDAGADHSRVKVMIDAGADDSRVKAMLEVDVEAKQLERIIHSFKKMELHASANPWQRSESPPLSHSPQRGRSYTLENPKCRQDKPPQGRPHSSAGFTSASKSRRGRFTEIKDGQQSMKQSTESIASVGKDPSLVQEKNSSLMESQQKVPERNELNDSIQRSTSACSSSSAHSIPKSEEDTICWKKGNILGRGAFGTVWCGLTGEGELIAVKQIELNTSDMEKAKREYEKIQEEVELLKTLTHKNIVGYLGTSFEDNFVSIYMQFVPGGSIASVLARFGALEERVFCLYTKQILEGVEYLHQNDVIHRDIKGGNIMLMPTGVIKLIDFGCAKRMCINLSMSRSQILKSMKGTPYWMAPEVVNETGHGRKSDIWSIGCTVFEMATRKPPWSDMSPLAAIFAIGCDKPIPQLPDHFSKDVRDFVNKCLTRDQNERMSATEALQHRFITRRRKSRAI